MEEDGQNRGLQTYSENGLHGDGCLAGLRWRVRPVRDRSDEVHLRRYALISMREFSARTGNSHWPFSQTALPDGSMNSMTLPNISKRLYVRWTNPCAHSNCRNFASIKNPHPFRGDCIASPDH